MIKHISTATASAFVLLILFKLVQVLSIAVHTNEYFFTSLKLP